MTRITEHVANNEQAEGDNITPGQVTGMNKEDERYWLDSERIREARSNARCLGYILLVSPMVVAVILLTLEHFCPGFRLWLAWLLG